MPPISVTCVHADISTVVNAVQFEKPSTVLSCDPFSNVTVFKEVRLFKVSHVWYNTYQERSGLPKLRIAHANVGDHCSMNKNSCPVHILSRFTRTKSKLCHVDGCLTKQDDVFIQRTQKMVDTMMACDVLSFCEEQNVGGVYIASDDIDLFPAIALGRNINNSMPLFLLVLNKKRFDYYPATLSDFNIKIRNCNE